MPCRIYEPPGAEKGPAQLWAVIFAPPAIGSFRPQSWSLHLGQQGPRDGEGDGEGEKQT